MRSWQVYWHINKKWLLGEVGPYIVEDILQWRGIDRDSSPSTASENCEYRFQYRGALWTYVYRLELVARWPDLIL